MNTPHHTCGSCVVCHRAYMKAYYQKHRDEELTYYKEHKVERRKYKRADVNNNGISKHNIRRRSSYILYKKRKHTKLENYEIHHCFGYDDPNKFIYIPKALHLQIHQRLREQNISAEDAHFEQIKDLINECQDYTYISI